MSAQRVQPVCLLLRPPNHPRASRGLRAPPSAFAEGFEVRIQPVLISDGANNIKISFHLSKILLFVKNKNDSRSFFFLSSARTPRESRKKTPAGSFLFRNILFFSSNARENPRGRKKTLHPSLTVLKCLSLPGMRRAQRGNSHRTERPLWPVGTLGAGLGSSYRLGYGGNSCHLIKKASLK